MSYTTPKAVLYGTVYKWLPDNRPQSEHYNFDEYWYDGTLISTSHPRSRDGKYREGGAFFMVNSVNRYDSDSVTIRRNGYGTMYDGRLHLDQHHGSTHPEMSAHKGANYRDTFASALSSRGAEAWNRMKPAQPSFELGLNILELKDTPGMLKQATSVIIDRMRKKRQAKGKTLETLSRTGEWYLAIEFGWLPILSAYLDFIEVQRKEQKLFDQIVRDAGRWVKRSRVLPDAQEDVALQSATTYGFFNLAPYLVSQAWGDSGRGSITTTTSIKSKTWCEGKFRYFLPPGPRTVGWKKNILRRMYGLRVTPTLAYNLMPWSWLADYFTDLGQFMNAVSNGVEDNLYCQYAYLMRTKEVIRSSKCTRQYASNLTLPVTYKTARATFTTTTTTKCRVAASPFGFGFREQDLSLKQNAILGALGLSRLPTSR